MGPASLSIARKDSDPLKRLERQHETLVGYINRQTVALLKAS